MPIISPFSIQEAAAASYLSEIKKIDLPDLNWVSKKFPEYIELVDHLQLIKSVNTEQDEKSSLIEKTNYSQLYQKIHELAEKIPVKLSNELDESDFANLKEFHISFFKALYENNNIIDYIPNYILKLFKI